MMMPSHPFVDAYRTRCATPALGLEAAIAAASRRAASETTRSTMTAAGGRSSVRSTASPAITAATSKSPASRAAAYRAASSSMCCNKPISRPSQRSAWAFARHVRTTAPARRCDVRCRTRCCAPFDLRKALDLKIFPCAETAPSPATSRIKRIRSCKKPGNRPYSMPGKPV